MSRPPSFDKHFRAASTLGTSDAAIPDASCILPGCMPVLTKFGSPPAPRVARRHSNRYSHVSASMSCRSTAGAALLHSAASSLQAAARAFGPAPPTMQVLRPRISCVVVVSAELLPLGWPSLRHACCSTDRPAVVTVQISQQNHQAFSYNAS